MNALMATDVRVIIYVDNDVNDLTLMTRCFQETSFRLICESSPVRALSYIQDAKNPLNALFTDLRMSSFSGIEVARQAKVYRPDLPTLGVTRFFHSGEAREFIQVTDLCVEKTPSFFRHAVPFTHNFLQDIATDLSREVLIDRAIRRAMHRWYPGGPDTLRVSPELIGDLNFVEFVLKMDELELLYAGEYVAFIHGKFVDHGNDQHGLFDRVYKSYGERVDLFVQKLAMPRIIDLASPKADA